MPNRSKDSAALYPTTLHSSSPELGRAGFFFTGRDLNLRTLLTGKLGSLMVCEEIKRTADCLVLVGFKLLQ